MGKRGPAPLPSNVKRMKGTYRKDRAAPNEPRPKSAAPNCPAWLSGYAKQEWRWVVKELERLGLMTKIDRAALAAYCEAYAEWRTMEESIDEHGRTQTSDKGFVCLRPEVTIRNAALKRMREFLKEFGMTPSSRTRVSAPDEAPPANPFSNFG